MKTLQEKNRLLLDFMGVKPTGPIFGKYTWCDGGFYHVSAETPEEIMEGVSHYAKYSTDYNWSMKVVKKINGLLDDNDNFLFSLTIHPDRVTDFDNQSILDIVENEHGETDEQMLFETLVQFVEWYNTHPHGEDD